MQTLAEIRAQIQALEEQAAAMVAQQKQAVIAQIKQQIADFGLTAQDLGLQAGAAPAYPQQIIRAAAPEKVIRYRRGDDTWSGGRGPKPKWISELLERGEDIEQFRVG
ncbi:MAG: hypothetical protein RJA44_2193 [Pseudomonadota bacterium]